MAWIGFNWMKLLENLLKEIEKERGRWQMVASCKLQCNVACGAAATTMNWKLPSRCLSSICQLDF